MGYTTRAYLVDLERVREVAGSSDQDLINRIVASNPEDFEDDSPNNPNWLPLSAALEQIVNGRITSDDATQFGYALEQICYFLGKVSLIGRYPIFAAGIDRFFDRTPPVQIPVCGDFPDIGYILCTEIPDELKRVKSLSKNEHEEDIQELLSLYTMLLRDAAREGSDIVLFYG